MQRSNLYVVYRALSRDSNGKVIARQFATSFDQRDDRDAPMKAGDVPLTSDMRKARTMDKKYAFEYALQIGGDWTVGELICDAKGVRVDE